MHEDKVASVEKILCPALRAGVKEHYLTPDDQGHVKEQQLVSFMVFLGWKKKSIISRIIKKARLEASDGGYTVNLSGFRGTGFDHGSSTGILNNHQDDDNSGFYQQRLNLALEFADEKGEFGYRELAHLADYCHKEPINFSSRKGHTFLLAEFSNILALFGSKNSQGKLVLTTDDVIRLWKDSKFPLGWKNPGKPFFGNVKTLINIARMHLLIWFTSSSRTDS